MAAATDPRVPSLVQLRHIRAADLIEMLAEEVAVWRETLDWDFSGSAALVQRFTDMQALNGYALLVGNRVVGYSYFVCEERKGLIGDLFVMREFATPEVEYQLLSAVLDAVMHAPYVQRVECQLMMLRSAGRMPLPEWRYLRTHQRIFMEIELERVVTLPKGGAKIAIEHWTERRHDEAAALIASSYGGHIDAEINDQYRCTGGARRFLTNIVQYPGCGNFFAPASYVALEGRTLCGISLASLVAADTGHITQICVSKAVRGKGAGYELLRRSLLALRAAGCVRASLTVTAANDAAIELYERAGFRKRREFAAYVWDGF